MILKKLLYIYIEKSGKLEQRICLPSQLRKLKCIEKIVGKYCDSNFNDRNNRDRKFKEQRDVAET